MKASPEQRESWEGKQAEYANRLADSLVPLDVCLSEDEPGSVRYFGLMLLGAQRAYRESHGNTPWEHLEQCQRFVDEACVPVALSVFENPKDGTRVAASIWQPRDQETKAEIQGPDA